MRGPFAGPRQRVWPVTDLGLVGIAVAALVGALTPAAVPVGAGVAAVGLSVLSRRAAVVALAVGVLTSGLSAQARAGLEPLPPGPFTGTVVLVSDPAGGLGGWRADARTDLGRVELSARGGAGGRLSSRLAGQRVRVVGRLEPLPRPDRAASRHVRARLVAEQVVPLDDGTLAARAVNALRGLVVDGADQLPEAQRALFTGFVLGDDRDLPVEVASDFDAAGMTHLLAVSGQNVVFVLAVAAPALALLPRRRRFAATLLLLVVFAAVTRVEPSVLRATTVAGVSATATLVGRPARPLRVLALSVVALLLVDPLLAESLGFRLSVAAAAGIVVLAGPLADALPGPSPVRTTAAVTLSAQAAVAPLLVPVFGPMPVAALPANVLAEPVAGLVMMWGCTAGVVAGLVPGPVAGLLHLPTRAGLWWVAGVARVAGSAPTGEVGLLVVAGVAVALGLAVALVRRGLRPAGLALSGLTVVALLVVPGTLARSAPVDGADVGGAELWRQPTGAAVLVVPGTARAGAVLDGLRHLDVDRLDLVVLRSGGPTAASVLATVRRRVEVGAVWAPDTSPAEGAVAPPAGPVSGGGLRIDARVAGEALDVDVALDPSGPAGRSPPAGG